MSTTAVARFLAMAWLMPEMLRPSRARTMTSSDRDSNATGTDAEVTIGLSSGLPTHASSGTRMARTGTHPTG